MQLTLTTGKYKTLSEFCNDVAKGTALGVILGQNSLSGAAPSIRIAISIFWIAVSLLLLVLALVFSKEAKP